MLYSPGFSPRPSWERIVEWDTAGAETHLTLTQSLQLSPLHVFCTREQIGGGAVSLVVDTQLPASWPWETC